MMTFHNARFSLRFNMRRNGFTGTPPQARVSLRMTQGQDQARTLPRSSPTSLTKRRKRNSALFLVDFEIQNDVLATVEARNRSGSGFTALFVRMLVVMLIRVQAAETVTAGGIGVTAEYGVCAHIPDLA